MQDEPERFTPEEFENFEFLALYESKPHGRIRV
jgi:hypothetical protein